MKEEVGMVGWIWGILFNEGGDGKGVIFGVDDEDRW